LHVEGIFPQNLETVLILAFAIPIFALHRLTPLRNALRNDHFAPRERPHGPVGGTKTHETPACQKAPTPNDTTNPDSSGLDVLSDIEKFAAFMRFLAPPVPSTDEPGGVPSINNGKQLFHQVGCTACHAPTLRTGHSTVGALDNKDVNLYSDLAIHDMGTGLADGVSQGQANGREFRSAPLWGLGQRLFFLHDGRTKDLVRAIREHRSPGSEANGVVIQFFRLRVKDQQDLLNFLRSL
jgi:CxxC motif-containing protein (DUF1111 family)